MSQRQIQLPKHGFTWVELDTSLPKQEAARPSKRIVQTETGTPINVAKTDAFLGERNQSVDRETVNRGRQIEMAASAPPKPAKREAFAKPLASLGLPILPSRANAPVADELPQWAQVGNVPQDYVRGIRESDRTALNTKEYVFYGYFQRIRERLDRAWVPILREKLMGYYRAGRRLASDMDHTTKVLVVLNGAGEIVRVQLLSESGSRDLDDAAVRAFNKAGPFPNPPSGIVDADGLVQIPWEFILKT